MPPHLNAKKLQLEPVRNSFLSRHPAGEVIYFDTIDSTNLRASRLGRQGSAGTALIVSESQTSGKGRLDRKWYSPPHVNLYFSVLFRPEITPQLSSWIPIVAGVAAVKGIRRATGLSPKLKWPNDLLFGEKKCAGILAENHIMAGRLNFVVIGIGVNVNMTEFPSEISSRATSLCIEKGAPVSRENLLIQILECLDIEFEILYREGPDPARQEWIRESCTIGREVSVSVGPKRVAGRAVDLDDHGGLIVIQEEGVPTTLLTGDLVQEEGPAPAGP